MVVIVVIVVIVVGPLAQRSGRGTLAPELQLKPPTSSGRPQAAAAGEPLPPSRGRAPGHARLPAGAAGSSRKGPRTAPAAPSGGASGHRSAGASATDGRAVPPPPGSEGLRV